MITVSIAKVKNGRSIKIDKAVILKEVADNTIGARPFNAEIDLNSAGTQILVFGEKNIESTIRNIVLICKENNINHEVTTIHSPNISMTNKRYVLHTPLDSSEMKELFEIMEKLCV